MIWADSSRCFESTAPESWRLLNDFKVNFAKYGWKKSDIIVISADLWCHKDTLSLLVNWFSLIWWVFFKVWNFTETCWELLNVAKGRLPENRGKEKKQGNMKSSFDCSRCDSLIASLRLGGETRRFPRSLPRRPGTHAWIGDDLIKTDGRKWRGGGDGIVTMKVWGNVEGENNRWKKRKRATLIRMGRFSRLMIQL